MTADPGSVKTTPGPVVDGSARLACYLPAMPTVDHRGASIYYETHGAPSAPPLLLLMGLGVDAHGWELQVPAFAERYRVILVDNRGIGRSSKPPGPYDTALLAQDALAVLDALSIHRVHLLGLSMGGMIAQEMALGSPERVGALILAVSYARRGREVEETTGRVSAAVVGAPAPPSLDTLLAGGVDVSKLNVLDLMRVLTTLVFSARFLDERGDWLRTFFMRSLGYGFSAEGFFAQVGAVMSHDTVARLPSLRTPTLVVTGSADALVPPRHSDELARLIPGARLEKIEGATHGLNFEIPERFNTLVLDFLDGHPLSATR
jgi:3-oxoadipate enol-lactonase